MTEISVIVPIYKVEQYLDRCLTSLVKQTINDKIEIILVDDGSPDNCGKISERYAKMYENIKVIHKENGGLSSARNAGINIAKGKYLCFIDSDDFIEKDMLEYLLDKAQKFNSDIAACGYDVIYNNEKNQQVMRIQSDTVYSQKQAMDIHLFTGYLDDVAWNKLYKIELFKKIKFSEGKLYEDMIIMPQILKISKVISIHPDVKYHYCKRNDSIGGKEFNKDTYSLIEACDNNVNSILEIYSDLNNIKVAQIHWHIVVCNKMILSDFKDKNLIKSIKKEILKNIINIIFCKYIGKTRKFQMILFLLSYNIYGLLYKNFIRKNR